MLKKATHKILISLTFILICFMIYWVWKWTHPAPQVAQPPVAVSALKVTTQDILPERSFVAKIESRDRVGLRARITGFLQEQLFKEGDYVAKDQPLFIIEPVNFEAALREAQANYDRAAARAKNAQLQYDRTLKLYKTKDVSKSRLEDEEATNDAAKADLAQMAARLDLAKKDLDYTTITAPMAGKIGESIFSVGELIGPNSGILASVVTVDPMDAVFSISENELLLARRQFLNMEDVEAIFITTDGYEYPEIGTIDFVDVTLDEGMNTLKLKASLPNPDHKLISGQYGRIKLKSKRSSKMLTIPQKAIQRTTNSEFVFVITPQNTVEQRTVTTGVELPNFTIEIVDGLADGDTIVVEGFQKITVGSTVTPIYE